MNDHPRNRWSSRRRRALPIRLRQELAKRIDAVFPQRLLPTPRLMRAIVRSPDGMTGDQPLARHLRALNPGACPSRDELLSQVERIMCGEWTVFHHRMRLAPGGPDWRAHPLSGAETPLIAWHRIRYMNKECGGDVKYIWELNRHQALLRLAQGWFLTRDPRIAQRLADLLDSWMLQNPPGRGVNWASSLEVGFRSLAWCWIAALTDDAPIWTAPRQETFLWQLWQHGRHLARFDSVHHSPNTHLTGEALALVYLGACYPRFARAQHWVSLGLGILTEEVGCQILPDGMHFERSTGYHRYTVEFLVHLLALARATAGFPVPPEIESAARDTTSVLTALRRPDGSVPVLGDEDGGSALPLSALPPQQVGPLLGLGSLVLNEPAGAPAGPPAALDLAWWLGGSPQARGQEKLPQAEAATSLALPDAGYFGARDSGDAAPWACLIDGGPHGGDLTGHAHSDCAAVEISRGDFHLVADPGSLTYTGDLQRREWDRSPEAHATVVLESRMTALTRGPFGWDRVPPRPVSESLDATAYWVCRVLRPLGIEPSPPLHERQILLARGVGVLVCDWLNGARSEAMRVTWTLPVEAGRLRLDEVGLQVGENTMIRWWSHDVDAATARLVPHPFAPSYGCEAAGTALLLRGTAGSDAVLATSFGDIESPPPEYHMDEAGLTARLSGHTFRFSRGRLPTRHAPVAAAR